MSLISFSPIADGVTGVNAAATNTPLNTIYNDYNGNITDANISTSAAIASTKLAAGSAWPSYTPTFTGMTIGNGTVVASYLQLGKTVFFRIAITFGSTTTLPTSSDNVISSPTGINTSGQNQYVNQFGTGGLLASGGAYQLSIGYYTSSSFLLTGQGSGKWIAFDSNNYGGLTTGNIVTTQGFYESS